MRAEYKYACSLVRERTSSKRESRTERNERRPFLFFFVRSNYLAGWIVINVITSGTTKLCSRWSSRTGERERKEGRFDVVKSRRVFWSVVHGTLGHPMRVLQKARSKRQWEEVDASGPRYYRSNISSRCLYRGYSTAPGFRISLGCGREVRKTVQRGNRLNLPERRWIRKSAQVLNSWFGASNASIK